MVTYQVVQEAARHLKDGGNSSENYPTSLLSHSSHAHVRGEAFNATPDRFITSSELTAATCELLTFYGYSSTTVRSTSAYRGENREVLTYPPPANSTTPLRCNCNCDSSTYTHKPGAAPCGSTFYAYGDPCTPRSFVADLRIHVVERNDKQRRDLNHHHTLHARARAFYATLPLLVLGLFTTPAATAGLSCSHLRACP